MKVFIFAVAIGAATTALLLLHLENRRLGRAVVARRSEIQRSDTLRRENLDLQAILTSTSGASENLAQQLADARQEVATLERRASDVAGRQALQEARDRGDLANSRDPRTGLTRMEHIQPAGRSTPSAAFQTAIWAALKGDEAAMIDATALRPAARDKANDLLAKLPAEARAQWTPEKLAALWMSSVVSDVTALQITDETYEDPQHAVVTFRLADHEKPEHVNLRLTSSGWKIVLSESVINQLSRRLSATTPASQ